MGDFFGQQILLDAFGNGFIWLNLAFWGSQMNIEYLENCAMRAPEKLHGLDLGFMSPPVTVRGVQRLAVVKDFYGLKVDNFRTQSAGKFVLTKAPKSGLFLLSEPFISQGF